MARTPCLIFLGRSARALAVLIALLPGARQAALAQQVSVPGTTSVELTIVGGADLNPNAQGRASPVEVRIFELTNSAAFEAGDFATLSEHPDTTLKADLIAQAEFVLRPGEIHPSNRDLDPRARVLGVVAGFRDLAHSVWRLTVPVKQGKRNFLLIDLDRDTVRLVPVDPGQS